jgi:hypothetical protein
MYFSLPLLITAVVPLCNAAPIATTKGTVLEKRDDLVPIIRYESGAWMNTDQMEQGINQWCSGMHFPIPPLVKSTYTNSYYPEQNGNVIPMGKALSADIRGLVLHSGGPGKLTGKPSRP